MSPASGHRDRVRPCRGALLAAAFLALLPAAAARGSPAGPALAPPPAPAADLRALLGRMDRAASLYRQAALNFSCRETIHKDGGSNLLYDYLYVVGKDGTLRDYRTRVGDSQAVEVSPESIPVKHAMLRPYSWVFLFGRDRWPRFRYRFLDPGEALGREAARVGFEPVPPILSELNDWTGTAWVEPATGRILRVEARKAQDLSKPSVSSRPPWRRESRPRAAGIVSPSSA